MIQKVCKYYERKYHYGEWYEKALLRFVEFMFSFALAASVLLLPLYILIRCFS